LLNSNRNPQLSKTEIEHYLKITWASRSFVAGRRIVGDDTDGHIDDIARFVAEDVILCAVKRYAGCKLRPRRQLNFADG